MPDHRDKGKKLASYTSASVFPVKLLKTPHVIDEDGLIRPRHLQLCPTNACNLKCRFCSCSEREKGVALPWSEVLAILTEFAMLGTRAITLTGGGEPLMYPLLNELIDYATAAGMSCGLVTNGILIRRLQTKALRWVRVSFSDERVPTEAFFDAIAASAAERTETDWAFSYVVTREPDFDKMRTILLFASTHRFTHVRFVTDLVDLDGAEAMENVKTALSGSDGFDLAIFQGRLNFETGVKCCYTSLLKPVIGADGNVYPCCGAQYALPEASRDFVERMSMGPWREYKTWVESQRLFDGSVCARCYYGEYNRVLEMMKKDVDHGEFV